MSAPILETRGLVAGYGDFQALYGIDTAVEPGETIAIIGAINAVIAAAYYVVVMREIWMKPVPDGDNTPINTPPSLQSALVITAAVTVLLGVLPNLLMRFGNLTDLTGAFGR